MTKIEKKALALLNECADQEVYGGWTTFDPNQTPCTRALCRAIERHEADKAAHAATIEGILKAHEAFRQEVSDAVEVANMRVKELKRNTSYIVNHMQQYIIPKPDPLVEAINDLYGVFNEGSGPVDATDYLREALAKRGLKIVETER